MEEDPERESFRWGQLVEQVDARCDGIDSIHLMDREGDNYDLFALMLRKMAGLSLVHITDRALADGGRLLDVLDQLQPKVRRLIDLNGKGFDDGRRTRRKEASPACWKSGSS